jgi:hypothetical protein
LSLPYPLNFIFAPYDTIHDRLWEGVSTVQ